MPDSRVTAIVVNYRSGADLGACLEALLADRSDLGAVMVLDNDSGDESWRPAEEMADTRVELVRSSLNLGLAGAVNHLLPTIATPYLAVVNPDVTVEKGWLAPLVEYLEQHPDAAVACPLVLMKGSGRVNSAGQHVHVTGLGFNRFLNRDPDRLPDGPVAVGGLHGAAFVIRTQILRSLGGWDDTGFLYHEDVALSWDVLLSGNRIACVPESRVAHDYHLTMYPEKMFLLERNRWALLLSHLKWGRMVLISPLLALTEVMVWGMSLIRGRRFLRAKARSIQSLWQMRDQVAAWRARVFSRGVYDSRLLYEHTLWSYPIGQLRVLGAERGESTRQPPGGLPV